MPRKSPLLEPEIAICNRLKLYRIRNDLPRRTFARMAGIDTSDLIRVELGRVPLKYGLAVKISSAFSVNPLWLAYGKGPRNVSAPLPVAESIGVGDRDLFSSVFASKLATEVEQRVARIVESPQFKYGEIGCEADPHGRLCAEVLLTAELREWIERVPDKRLNDLVAAIRYAALPVVDSRDQAGDSPEVIEKRRAAMAAARIQLEERREHLAEAKKNSKEGLTHVTESGKHVSVRSQMANLLARLKKATSQRGTKSQLAKVLGVPLANVSQWLSGEREPGGETTLRLLRWVEQQERPTTNKNT